MTLISGRVRVSLASTLCGSRLVFGPSDLFLSARTVLINVDEATTCWGPNSVSTAALSCLNVAARTAMASEWCDQAW
jgi:hypothetical protein